MNDAKSSSFDAIALQDDDSVATVIRPVQAGSRVRVQCPGGLVEINALDDIALCHKVAIVVIDVNEPVMKHGQTIGRATQPIAVGRHVHIHNLIGRDPADCLS